MYLMNKPEIWCRPQCEASQNCRSNQEKNSGFEIPLTSMSHTTNATLLVYAPGDDDVHRPTDDAPQWMDL